MMAEESKAKFVNSKRGLHMYEYKKIPKCTDGIWVLKNQLSELNGHAGVTAINDHFMSCNE